MGNPILRAILFFPRRIVWLLLAFLVMTFFIFTFMRAGAGDIARMLGPKVPPQQAEVLKQQLGLDQPLLKQYTRYLGGALRGKFGPTIRTGEPVKVEISRRLPSTLRLLGLSILVAVVLSALMTILGVVVLSLREKIPPLGTILQRLGQVGVALGVAIPAFILGGVLLYILAIKLRWLPVGGLSAAGSGSAFSLKHALLPILTLSTLPACLVTRTLLGEIVHHRAVAAEDRASFVLHALLSFLRYGLIQTIGMLGGMLVVESIFAWPGVGRLFVESVMMRDYPLLLGLVTYALIASLALRVLADLVQGGDAFVLLKLRAFEPEVPAPPPAEKPSYARILGLTWILLCLLLVVAPLLQNLGGLLVGQDRLTEQSLGDRNLLPGSESAQGLTYAWGTDALGRDLRSRARYALGLDLLTSLLIALLMLIPAFPGGLLAGYLARREKIWADLLDDLVMFPVDVLTSLPGLILLAFILSTTGPGLKNLLVWLALAFLLPRAVRMVRDGWVSALPHKSASLRLVGIHLGFLILGTGLAVITQPVMGFLGLGAQPPYPDLGVMVNEGVRDVMRAPHILVRPGLALLFAAFGWFLLADTILSRFGIYRRESWLELNR